MRPSESFLGKLALAATVLTAQPGCDNRDKRTDPQAEMQVSGECAEVKAQLNTCMSQLAKSQNPHQTTPQQKAENSVVTESVEVDPRLTTFKADFDADPVLK